MGITKSTKEVVGKAEIPDDKVLNDISNDEIEKELVEFAKKRIISSRVIKEFIEAFNQIEIQDKLVSDVVINSSGVNSLRNCGSTAFEPTTSGVHVRNQLMGNLWGARVWVDRGAEGINCFQAKSKKLSKLFPKIATAKELLRFVD